MKLNNAKLIATIGLCSLTALGANKLPNILWIITDDHRADSIQAYNRATTGQNYSKLGYVMSPEADKLADEGTLFTRAYCNSPGCAPSRTSMQYGMYPHHSGHYGFKKSHGSADFVKPVLPELMKAQGYQTALFGKTGYYINRRDDKGKMKPYPLHEVEVTLRNLFDHTQGGWSKTAEFKDKKKSASVETWGLEEPVVIRTPVKGAMEPDMQAAKDKLYQEQDVLCAYARETSTLVIGGLSPRETEQTVDGHIARNFMAWLKETGPTYTTPWGDHRPAPGADQPLFANLSFHFPHTPILPSKEFRNLFLAKEKEAAYKVPPFSKAELEKLPPQMQRWFRKTNFADMKDEDKRQSIRDYYAFCAMGDKLVGQSVNAFKEYSRRNGREWIIIYVIGDHGWHLGEQGGTSKFAPYDTSNHCAFSMRNRETNGKPGEKWGQKPGEDIQWALHAPREQAELMLFDLRLDPHEQNNVADDPRYAALADWFRVKLGRITLGDGRAECDWSQENEYILSDFAKGAHDHKLNIPPALIPSI
ncbi:sulfatase-like hydrolase/transferase [Pontiellaceae bacterium B12227]|nr:sulfatase-like hydrolase/transferase [Pontiellaceae bacterium B12227]